MHHFCFGVGVEHLAGEVLKRLTGTEMIHVPFKGAADASAALLGGHVDLLVDTFFLNAQVRAGSVRILSSFGEARPRSFPNVPTAREQGVDIVSYSPYGIVAPKGLDPKVTRFLHDAFKKALDDPEFHKILDRYDQDVAYLNSEDYAKFVRKIYEEEGAVIKRMGLKL